MVLEQMVQKMEMDFFQKMIEKDILVYADKLGILSYSSNQFSLSHARSAIKAMETRYFKYGVW